MFEGRGQIVVSDLICSVDDFVVFVFDILDDDDEEKEFNGISANRG